MKSKNRVVILLAAIMVIVMSGFGIAIPLMPSYITHFNASGSTLGLMMSLYSLMQFACAPFWGRLSDRIGRKPVLLIGIAGYAISFAAQGLAQNIFQFTLIRTLAGAISSATLPTAMAFIADTTSDEDRSRGVGMLGAAMGVGMIFGPVLGGMLTGVQLNLPAGLAALLQVTADPSTGEAINLSIPFFASALLALIAVPLVALFLPESLPAERPAHQAGARRSSAAVMRAALSGPSGFLLALAFLLAFAMACMEAVMALYGQQRFAMGPSQVGIVMGALGVLSVIMQGVVIGPLTKRAGEPRVIRGGLFVSIAGFAGMALAHTMGWYIASTLLFNAGNVLLQPSVTALLSKRAKGGQGTAMGLNQSFQSLGRFVGPLWSGFAFDIYATLAFWIGALVQGIALIVSLRMLPLSGASGATTEPALAEVGISGGGEEDA